MIVLLESNPDPQCAAKVDTPKEQRRVYRSGTAFPDCIPPGGTLHGRRVGAIRLGCAVERSSIASATRGRPSAASTAGA